MSTQTQPSTTKAILFLGATGGVGLSALRRSLAANHTCLALCRTPSTLLSLLSPETTGTTTSPPPPPPANLHIIQGNAHSQSTLSTHCLLNPHNPSQLVDTIIFSIGARPTLRGMDDPHVCEKGMRALLSALQQVRAENQGVLKGTPRLVVVSSTGVSEHQRDVPWAMVPLYRLFLGAAHEDKRVMERLVMESDAKSVEWTLIRGSLYTDGPETEGVVREGVEDPVKGVVEKRVVGYTVSREDVGKWVFERCIRGKGREWVGKAAVVTY